MKLAYLPALSLPHQLALIEGIKGARLELFSAAATSATIPIVPISTAT
jgi:hypothetical protein